MRDERKCGDANSDVDLIYWPSGRADALQPLDSRPPFCATSEIAKRATLDSLAKTAGDTRTSFIPLDPD